MRKQWMAAAAVAMALAGVAHAQDTNTAVNPDALARAQVLADLDMWHQSGMTYLASPSAVVDNRNTAEYRKYQELLKGAAYQEALAKHLGAEQSKLAKR